MRRRAVAVGDPLFNDVECSDAIYDVLSEQADPPRLSLKHKLYYLARPLIPLRLRHTLQHVTRRKAVNTDWYIERSLLRAYAHALGKSVHHIVDVWPDRRDWALALTHDVETAGGLRMIETIAALEEKYGVRSSWNFVAHKYPVDDGLLRDLKARGFEIGVHGYNHDGKDYLSRHLFRYRAKRVNLAMQRFGAVGFRSPQAQRNLEWMQELNISYDASCFDVDPFQPMPGGTGSIWPFRAGRFVELPYTIPQDHVLFITLRERGNAIWKRKTDWLIPRHGLVCLITHPDYLADPRLLGYYEDYLAYLAEKVNGWRVTPAELVKWWIEREESRVVYDGRRAGVEGLASARGASVLRVVIDNDELVFQRVGDGA